ncbi:hypothetical protein [Peredibacter starrii]|uniref:Uncharacterized protein n=1 Tax=Peredibacter starrii TaxID=28202 RepID=A0AAX4HMS6_9BACT|nr:hypothetical protein [Peredibacter starrii]WPU64179.1 hypothetical protein SOO65_15905 [Peredibacter starrii]
MKFVLIALALTFSVSSFAKHEKLIKACEGAAIDILQERAEKLGDEMIVESIKVDEVDARALNPFKYVWFKGNTVKTGEEIILLMQKPIGGECRAYSTFYR